MAPLEDGGVVRLDSTVTAALMHEPSDSSLLWDAVRVSKIVMQYPLGDCSFRHREYLQVVRASDLK